MKQIPNIEEESREAYAERYLLGRIFEIVQHYDKSAIANPPVVRKAVEDIIATLVTPHHQQLQKVRQDWLREEIVRLEGIKLGGHRDEDKRIYAGGYNQALTTIITRYKEELKVLESK